jgi:glycosyltransferase involved in cell wall biosynthesis
MLVTNVGGLAELVPAKKVGYVCEQNEAEIAAALVDFYTHKREEDFAKGVADEKQKFTWDYLLKALLGI